MITKTYRYVLIFLAAALLLPATLAARAQAEDIIISDPAVITGVLDNGLTYFVRANPKPEGRAELRLAIRAGSIHEDDDQQGLAHFAEHMLFNGTERYPKNELIDALEYLGMDFGPEINAYTSFDETVYQLFVRTDEWDQFELGLDVFEQWATRATLTDEEFEKERGVVYEEYRRGRGADARMFDKIFPVLFQGSRYAERLPIGLPEILLQAPPEALRRYYKDWYRPNLMGVVAVGDFDPDVVVKMIREKFSGLQNPADPRLRESYPVPSHDETLISIVHDPEATNASVEIYTKFNPPKVRFRPDIKTEITEQIFHMMMNQRLAELVRKGDPPFLYGYAFTSSWAESTSLNGLVAATPVSGTLVGLNALLTEAERAQRHGFTSGELERAKTDLLKAFESYWLDRNNLESSSFVQPLMDAFLENAPYPSIEWQWEAFRNLVPTVSLTDVRQMLSERLTDRNRVIIISGPSEPAITDLTEAEVRRVLNRIEGTELEPWLDQVVEGPLVQEKPVPGKVVNSSRIEGTDIEIWSLSNGATVVLKPTVFKEQEILFRAWSPGGNSKIEDTRYVSAQLAADAVAQGGLGAFSADALRKALAGKNITIKPFIQGLSEGFDGSATPEDLETMLQLHYLSVTAPRRDDVAWDSYIQRVGDFLANRESDPRVQYQDAYWSSLYDNHPRIRPLTTENLPEASLDEALAIYADRFDGAADFTYFFVGSFNPETLRPLVEQWIGGLPRGRSGETWLDRGIRYSERTGRTSVNAGVEPLSIVTQVWTGDWDGSWLERYNIQSLSAALDMKLLRTIREESSGTYSIGVYPVMEIAPVPIYRIAVQFTCAPDRVDELTDKVKNEIEAFRKWPPDEKYAHDVAESQRRSLSENLQRNNWWLGQMVFAIESGTEPETMLNRRALYDSLSVTVLQRAANRYFDDSNYQEIILFPQVQNQQ